MKCLARAQTITRDGQIITARQFDFAFDIAELEGGRGDGTYNMANLRGTAAKMKNRLKQMMKQIKAPRLQAPKMSRRSHRLTIP